MPPSKATAVAAKAANAAAKAVTKELRTPAFSRPVLVSPTMKKFLGVGETTRPEMVKKVWEYIKEHKLQNPQNGREIFCDESLKPIFGKDKVGFLEIAGLLNSHIPKKGDKKS